MKHINLIILVIFMGFSPISNSQDLGIMTYNIRLDVASDGDNAWPNRKGTLINQVLFQHPDILGVQEAKPNQMQDLNLGLKDYESFGLGRDGEQTGEHSSIFYNTKRLSVENKGTFWLSETPEKVSKGWDASLPRICTYGLFSLLNSDKKFWVFNTHLDHIGQLARANSLKLIMNKITTLNTENLPVILMGDFNLEPDSEAMIETFNTMKDARDLTKIIHGPDGTFTGFDTTKQATKRIDYIVLLNHESFTVNSYAVLAELIDQRYPSDHFPVMLKLHFD